MEIKEGSIWKYNKAKIRVDHTIGRTVYYTFLEHSIQAWVGSKTWHLIDEFLRYYKPVYIIEGFEV